MVLNRREWNLYFIDIAKVNKQVLVKAILKDIEV